MFNYNHGIPPGDTMGCGIYFPPDYDNEAEALSNDEDDDVRNQEEDEEDEEEEDEVQLDEILGLGDSDDDDLFFRPPKRRNNKGQGAKVTVSNADASCV